MPAFSFFFHPPGSFLKCLLACLALWQAPQAAAFTVGELAPWLPSITVAELQHQLANAPDINAQDAQGRTLLDHALCTAPALVPVLLDAGADATRRDSQGGQALHRLMRCQHPPQHADAARLVEILLASGLSPDEADSEGRTPLHHSLAQLGDGRGAVHLYRDAALLMLARGADPTLPDAHGITALHLSIAERDGQITALILDSGAAVDPRDASGRTPLWYAAAGRHNTAPWEMLLEAGADTTPPALRSRVLAAGSARKTAQLLHADPGWVLPTDDALAQLFQALPDGLPVSQLETLYHSGASPQRITQGLTQQAATLMPTLLQQGFSAQAQWLLEHALAATERREIHDSLELNNSLEPSNSPERGSSPERRNSPAQQDTLGHYSSPEHQALLLAIIRSGDLGLTRRLFVAGISVTQPEDAMAAALATDRLPLVQLVASHLPEQPPEHAWLLHYIQHGGTQPAMVEWLILDGTRLDAADADGNTALLHAARQGEHALVKLMLDHGADPTLANHSGCDLRCYYRPPTPAATSLPQLDHTPAAFFLLAFSAALILYFALAARQLRRRQPLLRLTIALLAALGVALAASASLFYQCQPCLATGDAQFWLTLAATTLLAALAMSRALRRR